MCVVLGIILISMAASYLVITLTQNALTVRQPPHSLPFMVILSLAYANQTSVPRSPWDVLDLRIEVLQRSGGLRNVTDGWKEEAMLTWIALRKSLIEKLVIKLARVLCTCLCTTLELM